MSSASCKQANADAQHFAQPDTKDEKTQEEGDEITISKRRIDQCQLQTDKRTLQPFSESERPKYTEVFSQR